MTAPTPLDPKVYAMLERLAVGLDVPGWVIGLEPPPAPTRRQLLARHVGQAGWRAGHTVSLAGGLLARAGHRVTALGHRLQRGGDRVIDGGDWLAGKVAGR